MIRCLALIGILSAGQVAVPAGEDLKTEVRRLVRQLDAPQLAQREAAEAELLRRGPAVLELLPPATDRASAEVQQRLGRIRQRLQQAAAEAAAKASTITLKADAMPLSKILEAFQEQSGNKIVDYRRQFSQPATDPKLTVNFEKTPFWPALDRLLDQAGLTLYPYTPERGLGVVDALGKVAPRTGRASYSGPFRFEAVWIRAHRDLTRQDDQALVVTFNAEWEPRLRIVSFFTRDADIRAIDEHGNPLPVYNDTVGREIPVDNRDIVAGPPRPSAPAVRLDVMLRLPPRAVQRIASFKGKLTATILGRIETFRFAKLADAKNVEQRIAGVTVTLEQVCRSGKAGTDTRPHPNPLPKGEGIQWEVRIRTRFDDAGDALASHRQWVFSNEAYLEGPDGKPIAYDTFETTAQGKNEVGVAYRFNTNRPLHELVFIYKTPGTIVTDAFEYELKEIKLP